MSKKPTKVNQNNGLTQPNQTNNIQVNINKIFPEDALALIEHSRPGFTAEYANEFIRNIKLNNDTLEINNNNIRDINQTNIKLAMDSSKRENIGQLFGIILIIGLLFFFGYGIYTKSDFASWVGVLTCFVVLYKVFNKVK